MLRTMFYALALLGANTLCHAEEAFSRITELTEAIDSISATFTQRVVDDLGRTMEDSSGTLAVCKPHFFRWHYDVPYEQLIVADGQRVWMHDIDLEQVTVKDQPRDAGESPLYLLIDPERLRSSYALTLSTDSEGIEIFRMEPESVDADFDWAEMGFADGVLAFLTFQDAFGQQTRIRFDEVEYNQPIADELFSFTPPEGIDVLGLDDILVEVEPIPDS